MPNTAWPSIHAKRMRLTKLDDCGAPVTAALNKSTLVTKGIVKITVSPEYEDGEDTVQKNGNGEIDWQYKDPDQLKYLKVEAQFTGVDPEAFSMITGQPIVLDAAGNAVGYKVTRKPITANFALETWSDVPGGACAAGFQPFGYFGLPFIGSGRIGDVELSASAAEFTMSATTKPGNGWGHGPYAVVRDEDDLAVPLLEALTGDDHHIAQLTTVAPPAVTNGAVLLTPYTPPTGP